SLADLLTKENYDVTVIEIDEDNASALEERLDVSVVRGNGASIAVLEKAGVSKASLLLAVTGFDEINMVSCMLGKQAGVQNTIARVSNPEYLEEKSSGASFLSGIDLIINPELVTAREIAKLMEVPEALDVMYYANHKAMMLELPITDKSPVRNMSLNQLNPELPHLVVAIHRNHRIIVPRGSDKLLEGDVIYLLARTSDMTRMEQFLGMERERIQKVMILGGGRTGTHLARQLKKYDYTIKIIEQDHRKCEVLSEECKHVLVINGNGTDLDLLKQEGTGKADVFISATDDDKVNLLVSVFAKHLGAKRTIALLKRSDYIDIMEGVGIDIGVSPRILTANAMYRFIKKGPSLLSFTLLREAEVGILEFIVAPQSKVAGKKLMEIVFPVGSIVGSIIRNGEVIIAKGNDRLLPEDKVIVFGLPTVFAQVLALFG
ncbi:MAG: Trk system potassium transporter TrkA, partial [Peptococcaceae bacterium]|nr:Trk system potassium transporter TrkA [Peptococcaceae bacterium]